MKKKLLLYISIIFLLSSCTLYQIDSIETTLDFHPSKKSTAEVSYFQNIEQPYEIIGYVTVNAERRQYLSEVIIKIKREAAILGGDAITEIKSDASGKWKTLPAQEFIGNAYVRANFTASVVILKNE